jgi:broad specificity phosphatase PhoE
VRSGENRPAPPACRLHPADKSTAWLLLLRHAPSSWNDAQRRQGWADPPLTKAAAAAARQWSLSRPPCLRAAASSDLRRALQTTRLIAEHADWPDVARYRALREQDQGAWTGLTKAQIKQRWPGAMRERPRRPLGGEAPEAVLDRVVPALSQIGWDNRGSCTLVVTHGEVIRIVERALGSGAAAVPHLEGRWLRVDLRASAAGSIRALAAGELTPGRLAWTAETPRTLGAGEAR